MNMTIYETISESSFSGTKQFLNAVGSVILVCCSFSIRNAYRSRNHCISTKKTACMEVPCRSRLVIPVTFMPCWLDCSSVFIVNTATSCINKVDIVPF